MKLIGYCCEDDHRVLVYEYMPRGSVENNLFSSEYSSLSIMAIIKALYPNGVSATLILLPFDAVIVCFSSVDASRSSLVALFLSAVSICPM